MHHGYHEDHEVERIKEYLTMNVLVWTLMTRSAGHQRVIQIELKWDMSITYFAIYWALHLLISIRMSDFSLLNQKKIAVFTQLRSNANHIW